MELLTPCCHIPVVPDFDYCHLAGVLLVEKIPFLGIIVGDEHS